MKKVFTYFIASAFTLLTVYQLKGQATMYLHQAIIANSGLYEFAPPYQDRATIGSYNPQNNSYTIFDTIQVESVQDIIIDSIYAYVAAEDSIIKYNINTYQRVATAYFPAIKKLEISGNYLMVGKWYGAGDYFAVFNKQNLQQLFSVPQIDQTVDGMVLSGDTMYVSYNIKSLVDLYPPYGIYADSIGKLGVINVSTQSFVRDIILGENAAGAGKSFLYNNRIYILCNETGYLFNYHLQTAAIDSNNIGINRFIQLTGNTLTGNFNSGIAAYDLQSNAFLISPSFQFNFINAAFDFPIDRFYFTDSDYFSYGRLYRVNALNGAILDSLELGISPEAIALEHRINSAIEENTKEETIAIFPNPFNNYVFLHCSDKTEIRVYNIQGKQIYNSLFESGTNIINTAAWSNGIYIMYTKTENNVQTQKLIKQ
jgi:hypothetical protein